ncbi:hypothetical protein ACFIOY_26365 [Bradyrhizobium sp. TZ2]
MTADCLAAARRGAGLVVAGGGSSALSESRWPSKIAVSHGRLFSVRTAQILAAAPASFNGPATSRSCMPRPLVPSFTTMIGRSVVSGAFDRDFNSPRHSARRPLTELALPRSTPNSVRCSATFGSVNSSSASLADDADATTSGIGLATMALRALLGSISFPAAGSSGAIIDCAATSGVAGEAFAISDVAVSAFAVSAFAVSGLVGSILAVSILAVSDFPISVFAASFATDETVAKPGSAALAAGFPETGVSA